MMSESIRYLDALLAALGLTGKARRGGALEIRGGPFFRPGLSDYTKASEYTKGM